MTGLHMLDGLCRVPMLVGFDLQQTQDGSSPRSHGCQVTEPQFMMHFQNPSKVY